MWPFGRSDPTVTCIACGTSLPRDEAREYDKYGDRWDRDGKEFEHLCKPCDRELCRRPRTDVESVLVDVEAGERDREAFVAAYWAALEERERVEDADQPDRPDA